MSCFSWENGLLGAHYTFHLLISLLIIFTVHCKCGQPASHLQCSDSMELLQTASQTLTSKFSHIFTIPSFWSLMHI